MATSRGFGEFSRRMLFVAKNFSRNVEDTVRKAAIAADEALVLSTPVDTGRARGNWQASIGTPQELIAAGIRDPSTTLDDGRQIISQWKLGIGPIFITNGVPYIVPLEEGHSQQAPSGMTKHGIAAAQAVLRTAKLIKE